MKRFLESERSKNAHFSSVPTRIRLFTCKKYNFLIEKNFPNLSASTKKKGNSGTTLPKLSKHLPMGRCLGRVVGTKFHRGFVVIPTN
ncbi:hypothetical protein LEP1GSC086_0940 [Leptospira weilii str. LNT 1234]|nr:hypothetical protein LEP1GSC086_0940 [Leptospira weilii str. LNT 1234]